MCLKYNLENILFQLSLFIFIYFLLIYSLIY